ncbi:MAG TPA: hypothetical protein VGC79_04905 [Polyangiaceae bacterium]
MGQIESTEDYRLGTISADADPADVSDRASKCTIVRGVVTESSEAYELSNVVETALAKALLLAAEGERWEIVRRIAAELAARRGERFAGQNRARATGNR